MYLHVKPTTQKGGIHCFELTLYIVCEYNFFLFTLWRV